MKKMTDYTLSELKAMGRELLSSRSYINNLPFLLTFVSPSFPSQHVLESILSLQSFFTPVLSDLPPSSSSKHSIINDSKDDPDFIYRTWLRSKFDEFVKLLINILVSAEPEETLKELVLDTVMEFVKTGKGRSFHSAIYYRLLQNIVHSTTPVVLLVDLLSSKYFNYIDVRYFTYISLEKLARTLDTSISDDRIAATAEPTSSSGTSRLELILHKMHYIFSNIPTVQDSEGTLNLEMWSESGSALDETDQKELPRDLMNNLVKTGKGGSNVLSVTNISKKMKQKFTKAWISFLRLPLPLEVYKEVLVNLHQTVIPHLSNPIVLCDFLTRSYDIGGGVSVMALSSLYVLMTQYGLEYPNFYGKLYALLVPSVFMAKHRAKFFQLLDSCLKSPLLPAYLAASFAKKLSRLSLSLPPSGSLVITALIHNLLRRHPSVNFLVHMEDDNDQPRDNDPEINQISAENMDNSTSRFKMSRSKRCVDQFNNGEANPLKSNAMRSSLWEIDTLCHHYCPPVSRFVLSLKNDLTVRAKTTEVAVKDFGYGSYSTIFGEEIRRRVKQVPLAFYKGTPTALFSDSDFAGWTFKYGGDAKNGERKAIDPDNSPIDDYTTTKRRKTESS